ncbi:hypothetical protein LPJ66_005330 [Kickxella alabastrina]|uniref:Uncharacterized protein n=1 Tax=Kickxella alabastrina TaxID=61397 RepID=A0ACC1IEU5_9FUNG|nr:hypothetical protein LPJ66_005330 [Kickxella alabastrina]
MLILLDTPNNKTLAFDVCSSQPLEDLAQQAGQKLYGSHILHTNTYITGRRGISASEALLQTQPWLTLCHRTLGGKGGFGSMLRSQGSKTSNKPANFDNCRDLYGRRLKTLNEAKTIVENIEAQEKERENAKERRRKKIADGLVEKPKKKYRFDDVEYTKECEEIVESTRAITRKAMKKMAADVKASASKKKQAEMMVPLFGDGLDDLDGLSSSSSSSLSSSDESDKDTKSDADDKKGKRKRKAAD